MSTRWLWLVIAMMATGCIAVTPKGKRFGIAPAAPIANLWNRRNDEVAPFEPLAPPTGNPFVEPDDPATPKPPV